MNIVVSGSTGFIASHLVKVFAEKSWRVIPLRREDFNLDDTSFLKKIDEADVVINLAGASVAERWSEQYKKVMYSSRIDTTRKIVSALEKMQRRPEVFISASAAGIYKQGGSYTEEDKSFADDFLGRLAIEWEREALKSRESGVRTVIFRFGIVLGSDGGALQKMLVPFRMGLGGVIGDEKQPFSWVHVDDLVRAFIAVIEDKSFEGTYNLTAPHPTTNEVMAKTLGKALHKPALMRVPEFVLRLQLGEGASVLLKGQRALPKRLVEKGFTFKFTDIEKAIEDLLKTDK